VVRGDAGPDRAAAGMDSIETVAEQRQDLLIGLVEEEVLQKWPKSGVISPVVVQLIDRWGRPRWNSVQTNSQDGKTGI
jgi:hypothetical protein